MIRIIADNKELKTKLTTFSDGASIFEFTQDLSPSYVNMTVTIEDKRADAVLWLAILVFDTITDKTSVDNLNLYLPYMPHARADRAFSEGMINARNLFIDMLTLRYDRVTTVDIHSPHPLVENYMPEMIWAQKEFDAVVAPDKGATNRAGLTGLPLIQCDKVRNPENGWITDYNIIDGDPKGKDLLIVDDICDGGMTFILCARALKAAGANSVKLYVTHGIFSKGIQCLLEDLDGVACYNNLSGEQLWW
jgi:ribose-phosphate pyrophosphokinase